jgi:hypothetical protein
MNPNVFRYGSLRQAVSSEALSSNRRMIPPVAQRAMAKRAGSTVVEVKGSHAIYVSQPAVSPR